MKNDINDTNDSNDINDKYAIEYQQAKKYALKRLSLQPMLSTTLSRSLKKRLVSEPVIQTIIQECRELGILNDEEWAASFVRGQTNRKTGPRAIAQKLASKGIRGEQLEKALEGAWDGEKQKGCIESLLKSRYGKRNLADYKERQKVISSLVRKGFDLSIVLECL
jgi:regulatory protein